MKKKYVFYLSTITVTSILTAALLSTTKGSFFASGINDPATCKHNGFHYSAKAQTYEDDGYNEFWSCCNCHTKFDSIPSEGTWSDGGSMIGGIPEEFRLPAYKSYDEEYENLNLPSLTNPTDEEKAQAILVSSELTSRYNNLPAEVQNLLHHKKDFEKIKCYGYVVYGDAAGDTITAYDQAETVTGINLIENDTYGCIYKVDIKTDKSSANLSFTLDGLLWKGRTIATDATKLVMFAANNASSWGSTEDDCNVAKLNNNYATIGFTQLDHSGTWGSISVDLEPNAGLVSDFTCYGFQEKWKGMKKEGNLYFSRLVAITNKPYYEDVYTIIDLIDELPDKEEILNSDDTDLTIISNLETFNEAKELYAGLEDSVKPLVTNYSKLEEVSECFDVYVVANDSYVSSDSDMALTLASETVSLDVSHGLAYDLTLRPLEVVADKVLGVKMNKPITYDSAHSKTFMYVYNPGNNYSLGFGDSFWGSKVGTTNCVGGSWTKIEVTDAFAQTLTYVTYGVYETPTNLIGWKFTPIYQTSFDSQAYKGLALEKKLLNLPLSYDVDTSSILNEEKLYHLNELESEYNALSEKSKAVVHSYSKITEIRNVFDQIYVDIYDCSSYGNVIDADDIYGLNMKQIDGSGDKNFGYLRKNAYADFDKVTIVISNSTNGTLNVFTQNDKTWHGDSISVPAQSLVEFTINLSEIPSEANGIYLHGKGGLCVSSCFGSVDTSFTNFH